MKLLPKEEQGIYSSSRNNLLSQYRFYFLLLKYLVSIVFALPHHYKRLRNQPLQNSCICEKVFVSTIHKAKCLEFKSVIIFAATDGVYPFFDKKTPEEIRESARLFYVAMTRAKKRLYITYAESVSGISKWGLLLYQQGTNPISSPHKETLSFLIL